MQERVSELFRYVGNHKPLSVNVVCRDDCRFPHVMPEGSAPHYQGNFPTRGGGPRPRGISNGNTYKMIEEKFAAMAVQEVKQSYTMQRVFSMTVFSQHAPFNRYLRNLIPTKNNMVQPFPLDPNPRKAGIALAFLRGPNIMV